MAKQGIKFDYDLMENEEIKEQDKCIICEESLRCRWTDYSGEGVCLKCGMAYQLKWGNDKQKEEGKYPYPNVKENWIPIVREYWSKTKRFAFLGTSFSEDTGLKEFYAWVKETHPELSN